MLIYKNMQNDLLKKKTMLEHNNKIIQKIIELRKIDILEFLRYGLEHEFIDGEFCSATALELMSKNSINDTILELASLIRNKYENQYEKAYAIIIEATKKTDVTYNERKQLYNKIWFFVFQLNNLLKLGIVS